MNRTDKHIITHHTSVINALARFDKLASDAILFLVDDNQKLIGALTDGDIRRGLIKGLGLEHKIVDFIQPKPKFFIKKDFSIAQLQEWRAQNYKIIPVLDDMHRIIDVVNFRLQKSYLPIDAVIMAGGKGMRLRPLTLNTPKPLLEVGGKPIIEYNIDRLKSYGVSNLYISISYLGQKIIDFFGLGEERGMNIQYLTEEESLGTIGAVSLVNEFDNDYVLVMNSDLLTNIDYEDMYKELLINAADMVVATTPYEVKIPYGVIETDNEKITDLIEKPTYTYYSNAGIYIIKKEHIKLIPKNTHFNATDLMTTLIAQGKKVIHYPILGYWLDIGKPDDFEKAQKDIKHIKF